MESLAFFAIQFFHELQIKVENRQVPVPHGQLLTEGKVAETCENAGMKALCYGDATCSWTKNANSR